MNKLNTIFDFQTQWTQSFINFCTSLKECNLDPESFFLKLPNFNCQLTFHNNLNDDELKLFSKTFFQYVLNDILHDSTTYKVYFNENGSAKMIQKQFDLLWEFDEEKANKFICNFLEFSLAMQKLLIDDDEEKKMFFENINEEEYVEKMLQNLSVSVTSLFVSLFKMFLTKYLN